MAALESLFAQRARPQVKDIELTNPGRKVIPYNARLEGGGTTFALETATVRVEPGRTARIGVRCGSGCAWPLGRGGRCATAKLPSMLPAMHRLRNGSQWG